MTPYGVIGWEELNNHSVFFSNLLTIRESWPNTAAWTL